MHDITDIEEKLHKMTNYINSLKIYCDKSKINLEKTKDLEEDIKYLEIFMDNLYEILRILIKDRNYQNIEASNLKVMRKLKKSYILSDKCIQKINFLNKVYKQIKSDKLKINQKFKAEFYRIIEYCEYIVDELFDCIPNIKYIP